MTRSHSTMIGVPTFRCEISFTLTCVKGGHVLDSKLRKVCALGCTTSCVPRRWQCEYQPRKPVSSLVLSKYERAATPYKFARFLIDLVEPVAVLWVMRQSVYRRFPGLDLWGIDRDANRYNGPGPIIAHPPCGPWGRLSWSSQESKHHGINAMRFVHQYGGVVEQPLGSQLFNEYGEDGRVLHVDQFDYGHRALKPTILYVHSGQSTVDGPL